MKNKDVIQLSDHFTLPRLMRFCLPSIVMMVFTSIYGVVDGYFVSNFVGKTAFASVNLVMPFLMILGGVGFMIGTGGSALVAKCLGEKNEEQARRVFSMMIYLTFILGVTLSVLGIVFAEPVARFLGCDRELASSFCWHVPLFSLRKYSIHIALSDSPKLLAAAEYISFCSFHRLLYAAIARSVLLCGWFSIFSLFFNSSLLLVSPNPDVSQINFIIIIRIRTFVKRKNILSG